MNKYAESQGLPVVCTWERRVPFNTAYIPLHVVAPARPVSVSARMNSVRMLSISVQSVVVVLPQLDVATIAQLRMFMPGHVHLVNVMECTNNRRKPRKQEHVFQSYPWIGCSPFARGPASIWIEKRVWLFY